MPQVCPVITTFQTFRECTSFPLAPPQLNLLPTGKPSKYTAVPGDPSPQHLGLQAQEQIFEFLPGLQNMWKESHRGTQPVPPITAEAGLWEASILEMQLQLRGGSPCPSL